VRKIQSFITNTLFNMTITIYCMLKTQIINIIINYSKYYNRKSPVWFSRHAAKDKNLTIEDVDRIHETIIYGNVHRSLGRKVCYKRYFKDCSKTYFVVVRYLKDSIKIITSYKKKGKW